jgi:hypothetical protein
MRIKSQAHYFVDEDAEHADLNVIFFVSMRGLDWGGVLGQVSGKFYL